jgi:type I restriction enzyme R subunit
VILYIFILLNKDGIDCKFLTPFKARHIQTTLDSYIYTPDYDVMKEKLKNIEYV